MTQCERIVQYMQDFGSISTMQAFSDYKNGRNRKRAYAVTDDPVMKLAALRNLDGI